MKWEGTAWVLPASRQRGIASQLERAWLPAAHWLPPATAYSSVASSGVVESAPATNTTVIRARPLMVCVQSAMCFRWSLHHAYTVLPPGLGQKK